MGDCMYSTSASGQLPFSLLEFIFIWKSVDKSLQTLHLCFLGVPLVGVNPFEYVTELYDEAMLEKYRTITPDEIKVREGILSQFWNGMFSRILVNNKIQCDQFL